MRQRILISQISAVVKPKVRILLYDFIAQIIPKGD